MRVRVDEAGEECHVTEVDDLRAGRRGAADGLDLVAADDHYRWRDDGAAAAVDEPRGAEHGDRLWRISSEKRSCE